jgi:SAM-dependent methyltransferase
MNAKGRTSASGVMGAAPEAYDRHVGRYGQELAAAMIQIADVRPGQRALDVGCGTGALTTALAALLDADHVAAIDPAEQFVEVCRSRVPGADVRLGAAEDMPFPNASFDTALAQLVVDGMVDARRGIAEMRRVTRPGGIVAACVWDFDGGVQLLDAVWRAARALDAERAHAYSGDRRPFSRPDELEGLWLGTELIDVAVETITVGADYLDLEDLWYPFVAGVGRLGAFVQSLEDEERARMKLAVGRNLGDPTGAFRLGADAWYVRGTVPFRA